MNTALKSLIRLAFLLALAATPLLGAKTADAAIEPGPGKGWLTIASRSTEADAVALAMSYAARFPTVVVFQATNGFYAVTLGWADRAQGEPYLRSLASQGVIPSDSYFHSGERYLRPVWSAGNAHVSGQVYSGTYLLGGQSKSASAPLEGEPPTQQLGNQPGYVAGLDPNGDNFLSLRLGPGTNFREAVRMRPDTELTIHAARGGWLQVSLPNGVSGWASARYIARGQLPRSGQFAGRTKNNSSEHVPTVGPEKKAAEPAPLPEKLPEQKDVASAPAAEPVPDVKTEPQTDPKASIANQKRVALVIGNSRYKNTAELPNPRNDATAMAAKLSSLGFTVISAFDGSKAGMESAVREFVKAMPGSDVALLFYAGHGMQVSGNNYLIPVDAKLEDATALDFETIDLGVILNFMSAEKRISIAILDACRDNPLSRRFSRSLGAARSAFIGRGLAAPASAGGEMLIGFATAPGEVALDGDAANSPFTIALLKHMDTKGLEIELMLKRVKDDVFRSTNEAQEPWHNSALRHEFYLNPQ